ncbi:MAG: DUF1311 domain-containing protein [Chromatiales bacterium]|nr:DUF1311 domain-containing protein [Chromatiales bacterium]
MRRHLLGCVLLAAAGPLAAGVTPPLPSVVTGCEETSADRAELALCLQEAALEWNLVLHERYATLRAGLTGEPARRLLTSQRSFIRYRDLHCTALAGFAGSASMRRDPVVWQTCNLRLTLQRIEELHLYP